MSTIKPGQRLKSAVCNCEVMVIKYANDNDAEITCGGLAMSTDQDSAASATADPEQLGGTQIGKRYVDADGKIELLCVKAGEGSLASGGTTLELKDAKPLPSSD